MQRSTVSWLNEPAWAEWAPQVRADQIAALYRNLPTNLTGATVVATLVAAMLYGRVSSWIISGWLLAVLGLAALRFILWRQFNAARPDTRAIGRWGRRIVLTTTAAGMLWGLGGVLLHSPGNLADQLFLLIVEIIIALASTCLTAMLMPAFFGFVYPILLLSAAPFLFAGDLLRLGIGAAALLLLPPLTQMALRDCRAFAHSARLRMQNDALLEELRRQKLAAESANEAKSRFLAVASHDLRQPLHALGLFVETLQDSALAARERHIVNNIRRSVDMLHDLFDAVMDISRLDAGAVDPQVETFELAALFERLRFEFEPLAREKALSLRVIPASSTIHSDPALLERILRNFVSNAVRYTSRGGVLLGCRRSNGQLRIEVWDTGQGIPADKHREVFREFVQLDRGAGGANAGRANGGANAGGPSAGVGLGLAIVERLARLLDHPVRLRSRHGRGSVFAITVPRGREPHSAAIPAARMAPIDLAGLPVLLVDVPAPSRAALEPWFARWNCEVAAVRSGAGVHPMLRACHRAPALIIAHCRSGAPSDASASSSNGHAADSADLVSHEGNDGMARCLALIELLRAEFNDELPAVLLSDKAGVDHTWSSDSGRLAVLHEPISPARWRTLVTDLLRRDRTSEVSRRAG